MESCVCFVLSIFKRIKRENPNFIPTFSFLNNSKIKKKAENVD